ncbi:DUF6531 domain-containing protein [Pseudomonas viridiflava]|uniref:DUF6531 domain-containing protein n=2 Tax=Pseudomonas viridiflava TaxID=33069 RepID=UPI0018E63364|nr:DUF6531 domain-containing protein [Pseudomonas viridiflava]MBI6575138.1 RHS repeat protein [Pseudomonas viridiflava]MBI6610930.1 RHS repeat protein [Pseudomonas viridiflava]MBI6640262.1 RHS repeat protein [Pseudomonas viridiflava]
MVCNKLSSYRIASVFVSLILVVMTVSEAWADEFSWSWSGEFRSANPLDVCRTVVVEKMRPPQILLVGGSIGLGRVYYQSKGGQVPDLAAVACKFSYRLKSDLDAGYNVVVTVENFAVVRSGEVCGEGKRYNYATGACGYDEENGVSQSLGCVGNPISLGTGNKYQLDYDYRVATGAEFYRFYNSSDGVWRHNYSAHIDFIDGIDRFNLVKADGATVFYSVVGGRAIPDSADLGNMINVKGAWVYESVDGQHLNFDSAGRLIAWSKNGGLVSYLSYSDGHVIVKDSYGNGLIFSEDAQHQPLTFSTQGLNIKYFYDVNNRLYTLVRYHGLLKEQRQFHYDDERNNKLLTSVVDERGALFGTWTYDSEGRATSSQHNGGASLTKVDYHSDGSRVVTNELGKVSIYRFQQVGGQKRVVSIEGEPSANCPVSNSSYSYDEHGLMLTKTDAKGLITTYTYNDSGLEVSRTEASGTTLARTVTTEWDSDHFLPIKIVDPERITEYTYDGHGRELSRRRISR